MHFSSFDRFYQALRDRTRFLPNEIHWELTYRCNLRCRHCYCLGLDASNAELSSKEIKKILQGMRRQGVLWLTLTGGEPLARLDFLEIYAYARQKGFLVSIFTNGLLWDDAAIRFLKKSPPYSIEITVNGITQKTYETITGVAGSFELLKIKTAQLFKSGLPLVVKSNLLKANQSEIGRIKKWAEKFLGRPPHKHFFKYDPFIYPRLNGDKTPLQWRLSFEEIEAAVRKDADIQRQYKQELRRAFPPQERPSGYLYQCSSWQERLCINPAGKARFCLFSDRFQFDLKEHSLEEVFERFHSSITAQRFKTDSRCQRCSLRPICIWCPAKACLETGSEEKPILSYCRYARQLARATLKHRHEKNLVSSICSKAA